MSVTVATPSRKMGGLLAVGVLILVSYFPLQSLGWESDVQFHTLSEAIATLIAGWVSILAFVRYYSVRQSLYLFIGTGFLGAALLDAYHTLVTSSYIQTMMPSNLAHLAPWSWLAARLFLSIMMVITALALASKKTRFHRPLTHPRNIYIFSGLFTILSFALFTLVKLPTALYPDFFFHRPAELIPGILFLIALLIIVRNGRWQKSQFQTYLVAALLFSILAQCVYMPLSAALFDISFDMAHLLKIASYAAIGIGLVTNIFEILHRERDQSRALDERNQELEKSKAWLEEQIAARQEIEAKLKEREKNLVRSNEELEMFAFLASHDLQEPLRKIQAFSDRLIATQKEALSEKGQDYLERMNNASQRMQILINDLLTFSRVTSRPGAFRSTDLNEVFGHILSDIDVTVEEKQAKITVDPLENMDVDPVQMRQLFQNLICNAMKYQKPGNNPVIHIWGEKHIVPPTGDTNEKPGQTYYQIHVEDNGIGIEKEQQERIFQMFTRLHSRDAYEGSGVGLSVARKIARRHGGDITVESTPGKGSHFIITLKWGLQTSTPELERAG